MLSATRRWNGEAKKGAFCSIAEKTRDACCHRSQTSTTRQTRWLFGKIPGYAQSTRVVLVLDLLAQLQGEDQHCERRKFRAETAEKDRIACPARVSAHEIELQFLVALAIFAKWPLRGMLLSSSHSLKTIPVSSQQYVLLSQPLHTTNT